MKTEADRSIHPNYDRSKVSAFRIWDGLIRVMQVDILSSRRVVAVS